MLLFIELRGLMRKAVKEFQYISCYCLSPKHSGITPCSFISIHLMLLFILLTNCGIAVATQFQYISCYCLSYGILHYYLFVSISIHLMLLFIIIANTSSCIFVDFNTSHVTVYPFASVGLLNQTLFQYISCYCLSFNPLSS